jgi:hypothetical protein
MKQTGFYKLSYEYIVLVNRLGGKYRDGKERPVYCCIRDRNNPGIYWAVPTSDMAHRTPEQLNRIKGYCALPERDIRSCYYHLGHTNRPAIFKISNALPVTEKYTDGEYISQGTHLVLRDKKQIAGIERKLSRILFDESRHPDKYEQHIINLPAQLVQAMEFERSEPVEWFVEDKATLALKREKTPEPILKKNRNSR